MISNLKSIKHIGTIPSLKNQPCVRAVLQANMPYKLKRELNSFIKRNVIRDCDRVSPNCLKAHMIKTAKKLRLPEYKIKKLKKLFPSKIGYGGYYIDSNKLKKI